MAAGEEGRASAGPRGGAACSGCRSQRLGRWHDRQGSEHFDADGPRTKKPLGAAEQSTRVRAASGGRDPESPGRTLGVSQSKEFTELEIFRKGSTKVKEK